MSRENVEIVRESVAAFSAKDRRGLVDRYAEDAVVIAPNGWPDARRSEGRDAVIAQFTRLHEDWKGHSMQIVRHATSDDRVVVELAWAGEGATSGLPFQMTVFGAYRLRAGRISEARFFWEWDEALQAVGLSE